MELCMARYWNIPGESSLGAKLVFHSVKPSDHHVYMVATHIMLFQIILISNTTTTMGFSRKITL